MHYFKSRSQHYDMIMLKVHSRSYYCMNNLDNGILQSILYNSGFETKKVKEIYMVFIRDNFIKLCANSYNDHLKITYSSKELWLKQLWLLLVPQVSHKRYD